MRVARVAACSAFALAATSLFRPAAFLADTPGSVAFAQDAKLTGDLAKAIRAGDLEAVKEAVGKGADLNALDERKIPPIGAAALLGKTDIIEYLADKGADVNRNDGFGFTPLMCAAQRGQAGAVRMLLKHGADPVAKGGNHLDAMTVALPKGPADPLFDGKQSVQKIL
ncbi:MAG: transient receptor potential channel pyrexia, partial [Phycisphaerales bacterium]|nr:transient receptor potential channel pyrexia [Phycisphaerales bacterium]